MIKMAITLLFIMSANIFAGESEPKSLTIMEFGEENTLFVADPNGQRIFALKLPQVDQNQPKVSGSYNLKNIDRILSRLLRVKSKNISIKDIMVRPGTEHVYISLSIKRRSKTKHKIVVINQKGNAKVLNIAKLSRSFVDLQNTASDGVTFWRTIPASSFTVTDLDYAKGELYVSGLSNGEFASTFRKISYPFNGESSITSVKMFHAVHNQYETRAPIRAMELLNLNGIPTVLAAYMCTPLVTIPSSKLKDGESVVGKTIAELGYGNTPIEILSFDTFTPGIGIEKVVLVINKNMGARLIKMSDLEKAEMLPGLTGPISGGIGSTAGVKTITIPMTGILQAADQSPEFLVMLRRNIENGQLELVSVRKGAYFRLSDIIGEANFPGYIFRDTPEEQGKKQFQNLLMTDEGFSDLIHK